MADRLSEQFASHEAFLETGGTQACEQVEIVEVGNLADEGMQITCCKSHRVQGKFAESQVFFSTNFSLGVCRLVQKTSGSTKLFPEALPFILGSMYHRTSL